MKVNVQKFDLSQLRLIAMVFLRKNDYLFISKVQKGVQDRWGFFNKNINQFQSF
jgi:hypothetical protein